MIVLTWDSNGLGRWGKEAGLEGEAYTSRQDWSLTGFGER